MSWRHFTRQVMRTVHPLLGKKYGQKLLPDTGPDNTTQEGPDYQGQLNSAMDEYGKADQTAATNTDAASKAAGTYSNTAEGAASRQAEAGQRAIGMKTASKAHINALRASLGLPPMDDSSAVSPNPPSMVAP